MGIENLEIVLDYLSSMTINNDAERTNSSSVTLNLEAEHEAGIVAYFASENGTTPSAWGAGGGGGSWNSRGGLGEAQGVFRFVQQSLCDGSLRVYHNGY